jgi:YidC/Oxa1 family membrane protein insertase
MEKRVLLATFLAFIVLYAWQALVVKPVPKPAPGAASPAAAATTHAAATPGEQAATAAAIPASATPASAPAVENKPAATMLVGDSAEHDVRVETRDVVAVFTNRGGRLKSWQLKHYMNQEHQPQELVERDLGHEPLPFTLKTTNDALTSALNNAIYAVSVTPSATDATPIAAPTDLRFEYRDSNGLHAVKQFHFDVASYIVSFHDTVTDGDREIVPAILWGPAIGDIGEISRFSKKAEGLLFQTDTGKILRLTSKEIAKQSEYDGQFHYAGVDDTYFMTAVLQPGPVKIAFQPISIPPPPNTKDAARELMAYSIQPKGDATLKYFVGPKDFDLLTAIDTSVARAVDFGMFTIIVVPLLRSLKWVNGFVGNYGWSIIILTIIINVIMFPLRHKSMVSMRKMQEIQPQIEAIKARWTKFKATDPNNKMNSEMMALYKEKGVNPASGCVPMLLTFPFIFAFYALLSTAIELRGAPFLGWIHDLSAHDPYFVMPILMGVSQFWQQRLTPQAGMDPTQRTMMMVMPAFFMFFLLYYPSGVALYWLVNNVWGIGQQYLTNYLIGPPNIRAARPPAERRMKRVGGGKTQAAAEGQ